jgi:NTE family protein
MAVMINGAQRRVGLALSGGGFRAAAFHLGVFRKLRALGLLWKMDVLSCVSGGSIAGAFLAARWGNDSALDELEGYLSSRSIAVASFLGGLVDPTMSRLDKLAESYDRDLFQGATLGGLPPGPRLYLNATNLSTGNRFFFGTGGGGKAEMGEHEHGVVEAQDFAVSRAVAASSAFPPVFNPLVLTNAEYPPQAKDVEYASLTDGGAYDNLGINPLLSERNEVSYAVVSDGGSPFAVDPNPADSGLGVLKVLIQILMEQIRGLQFERLQGARLNGGPNALWFSIDSQEGQECVGDPELASAIGTNLKRLSSAEMTLLNRHGAALVHARLKKYAPELLG